MLETDINYEHEEMSFVAYLCTTLKNNGDKKISNLALQIIYYDNDDNVIHKAVIKNALNKPISPGETQKYKIRLRNDFVNVRNEQFPYDRANEINEYDVNIMNVKLAKR